MQFALAYDETALVFLIIVVAKFYSQRQFPLLTNRLFGWVLGAAVLNLLLDIAGTLSLRSGFPVPLAYVINTLYYVLQIGIPCMLSIYILARSGCRARYKFFLVLCPGIACEMLLLSTVPLKLVFTIDPVNGYQYGPLYIVTYICATFYMLVCVTMTIALKSLTKRDRLSILSLIGISVGTMVVQYFFPEYTVTGTGIAAALVIVNFAIQDPGMMLDSATGVFNNGALRLYLQARLDRSSNVRLIGVKVEGLKQVTALYGMHEGENLLAKLADFLAYGEKSWVFRMNEDSFMLVLRKRDSAEQQLERLGEWENCRWPQDGQASVRLHTVCLPDVTGETDAEELINVMEAALRSRTETDEAIFYLDDRALKYYQRMNAIEKAMRIDLPLSRGFRLVFQPIRDLESDTFRSAEALLRYDNPGLGTVGPDEFVKIAERAGLAAALDETVIRLAFTAVAEGVFRDMDFTDLHVNLSSASLAGESVAQKIRLLQQETGIDPHFIVLEITETAAATAAENALKNMESLREQGFRFAMDDFGTGYSSLTRLMQFPFSIVKLDRSLLRSSEEVYRGLVRIFREMDMSLVAEGVENQQQADFVRNAGVRYIQGFHYAYPQTAEELRAGFGKTRA